MSELTKEFIEQELATKSIRQIADENKTYPNKIRRLAMKLGIELPDKGDGYKKAIKNGRAIPPMLGKTHSSDAKDKIANKRHDAWNEAKQDPEKMEELRKIYKKTMDDRSPEDKADMRKKAAKAIRATRTTGSKLERFLMEQLFAAGYRPQFHVQAALIQTDLEIDIYLPELKVAIEVDGVTHSEDIYGGDHLKRQKFADSKKNGLLLGAGFCIIRVDNTVRHVTPFFLKETWEKLAAKLEELKTNPVGAKIIYLD